MKKIENLEEQILELQAEADGAYENALTEAEEDYAEGYLDAIRDVAQAIEGVWGWTRITS